MKRAASILGVALVGAAFCVGEAAAYTWELITSYPTPGPDPRGYSVYSFASGWIVQAGTVPHVYHVYWYTGSIISSFPAPGGRGAWGISRGRGYNLYISNVRTSLIYEITRNGSVVSSFECPVPGPADMDLRWYPSNLYVAIPDRNIIAVVDETTGSLVSTFKAPGSRPTACCGYQTTLIADSATHTIYEDGVPVITAIYTPMGTCWEATTDNDYYVALFVVDDATDRIYIYNKTVPVFPASLGRVKALFR